MEISRMELIFPTERRPSPGGDSIKKKYLCVLFFGHGWGCRYCYICCDDLLHLVRGRLSFIKRIHHGHKYLNWALGIPLKDSLYLFGRPAYGLAFNEFVHRLKIEKSKLFFTSTPKSPKSSNKEQPIDALGFECGGEFYFIARTCNSKVEHFFQCYEPETGQWHVLDLPPYFDLMSSMFFDDEYPDYFSIVAHVVLGHKICISTEGGAYAYDTVHNKWEACHLFGGFKEHYNYELYRKEETFPIKPSYPAGQAFEFLGRATLYKHKYLLSFPSHLGPVIGFEMQNDKVVSAHILFNVPEHAYLIMEYVIAFDEDYFCVVYRFSDKESITFDTFKVSVSEQGRLKTEIHNKLEVDYRFPYFQMGGFAV